MADGQLLVVDDEEDIAALLEEHSRAARRHDAVLARLRAMDPTIAVVMLTGNDDEALARALLRAGALDYVPKPFELDVLEPVMATAVAVGRRGSPRRLLY